MKENKLEDEKLKQIKDSDFRSRSMDVIHSPTFITSYRIYNNYPDSSKKNRKETKNSVF